MRTATSPSPPTSGPPGCRPSTATTCRVWSRGGRATWVLGDERLTPVGVTAPAGWPTFPPEYPQTYEDCHPGAYDAERPARVHGRGRDLGPGAVPQRGRVRQPELPQARRRRPEAAVRLGLQRLPARVVRRRTAGGCFRSWRRRSGTSRRRSRRSSGASPSGPAASSSPASPSATGSRSSGRATGTLSGSWRRTRACPSTSTSAARGRRWRTRRRSATPSTAFRRRRPTPP